MQIIYGVAGKRYYHCGQLSGRFHPPTLSRLWMRATGHVQLKEPDISVVFGAAQSSAAIVLGETSTQKGQES